MTEVYDYINNLEDKKLIQLWNDYCSVAFDSMMFTLFHNTEEELWEHVEQHEGAEEFAIMIEQGDYRESDKYMFYDGHYNLSSTNDIRALIDESDIAHMSEYYGTLEVIKEILA